MAIDDMPTAVYLFHYPYAPGNGNFVLDWWRFDDSANLFRLTSYFVFFIFLEDGIELEVVDDTLPFQSDDQSTRSVVSMWSIFSR